MCGLGFKLRNTPSKKTSLRWGDCCGCGAVVAWTSPLLTWLVHGADLTSCTRALGLGLHAALSPSRLPLRGAPFAPLNHLTNKNSFTLYMCLWWGRVFQKEAISLTKLIYIEVINKQEKNIKQGEKKKNYRGIIIFVIRRHYFPSSKFYKALKYLYFQRKGISTFYFLRHLSAASSGG